MNVAIICEFSGRVRDEFSRRGHRAVSCDLLPSLSPGEHWQGDARSFDWSSFDLVIAHPPCTYLAKVGACWLKRRPERLERMAEAAAFFHWCRQVANVVENPVPMKRAGLGPFTQIIQPWQHGDAFTKKTCLWIRGVPLLKPSEIVTPGGSYVMPMGESKGRQLARCLTFPGIARAMAAQWG